MVHPCLLAAGWRWVFPVSQCHKDTNMNPQRDSPTTPTALAEE